MFRQSVSRWCYDFIPLEEFCEKAAECGVDGIDLLHPDEAEAARRAGLSCPVTAAPDHQSGIGCIERAFNRAEHHDTLHEIYQELIPAAAAAGISNVITFSGNRDGISDRQGLENCARGISRILPLAEDHEVVIVMELLNSKVDHPDYQCDHTAWGVALCEAVDHPRFKLLYDIYHMQVMEGDIIATIRKHAAHIGHYHTAGVPGRHEIGQSQELNYPAIMRAIADTGFDGFVGHEFVPTSQTPLASLAQAVDLCRLDA